MNADLEMIGTIVAFTLTLLVYAYLIKDIAFFHAIYRLIAYLFVGVSLGYAAVMAVHGVLGPRLFGHLQNGEWTWAYLVPLILCVLLVTKLRPSWSSLGNVTIAFLFGVGAALAVGGGVIGTLIPQRRAVDSLDPNANTLRPKTVYRISMATIPPSPTANRTLVGIFGIK